MDEDLRIDMRAQSRISLAPEEGGSRSTAQRSAPRLASRIIIDPTTTCVIQFAKLLAPAATN
eukprot:1949323-Pleurochrysis_carterae.AAC.1